MVHRWPPTSTNLIPPLRERASERRSVNRVGDGGKRRVGSASERARERAEEREQQGGRRRRTAQEAKGRKTPRFSFSLASARSRRQQRGELQRREGVEPAARQQGGRRRRTAPEATGRKTPRLSRSLASARSLASTRSLASNRSLASRPLDRSVRSALAHLQTGQKDVGVPRPLLPGPTFIHSEMQARQKEWPQEVTAATLTGKSSRQTLHVMGGAGGAGGAGGCVWEGEGRWGEREAGAEEERSRLQRSSRSFSMLDGTGSEPVGSTYLKREGWVGGLVGGRLRGAGGGTT
jgi:hypothetical protein